MSHPTFATWQDRVTYLLAEYKLLVSGMLLGLCVLVVYYQPQLPSIPDWVAAVTVGWLVLGLPCYLVGLKIARWLHYRNWVTVFHINSVTDEREKYKVPPSTWDARDTDGSAPNLVNDGDAYEVREIDWMDDLEKLRVTGTWLGAAKDSELLTARAHMEAIHDGLLEKASKLSQLRARWSDRAVALQEDLINAGAEARERGLMLEQQVSKDRWQDMRGDIEDNSDDLLEATHRDLADDERRMQQSGPPTNGDEPQ